MSAALLDRFDAAKAEVKAEIRQGFFNEDGSLKLTDQELWCWIGDRAVDELRVVSQLSSIVARSAGLLPANVIGQIAEQMADEAKHYEILRAIVPEEFQGRIDQAVAELPSVVEADAHWQLLVAAAEAGDPFRALLDINIVHEGFSAAAIEELLDVPVPAVREAYRIIGADEEKHHEMGRDLIETLAAGVPPAMLHDVTERAGGSMQWSWPATAKVVGDTNENPTGTMQWSWPSPGLLETAHERAVGDSMQWSWPAPSEVVETAHERASGGSMQWSWPAPTE